jgi:hypothetical protein
LTSALVGGECSTSRTGRFTPGERAPGIHWIGGWVDLKAGQDDLEKRKFVTLSELELRPHGRPAVTSRYTDYAIPFLIIIIIIIIIIIKLNSLFIYMLSSKAGV